MSHSASVWSYTQLVKKVSVTDLNQTLSTQIHMSSNLVCHFETVCFHHIKEMVKQETSGIF